MKVNQKGFELVGVLLVVLLLGFVGFASWTVYKKNSKNKQSMPTAQVQKKQEVPEEYRAEEYKRATTVPTDWKKYENREYGVSFSYRPNWMVNEGLTVNTELYDYSIGIGLQNYGITELIGIRKQSLEDAVASLKKSIKNSQEQEKAAGWYTEIAAEKKLTLGGHPAIELTTDYIPVNSNTPKESLNRHYLVFSNSNTYYLPVFRKNTSLGDISKEEFQIFFDSININ